MKTVVKTFAGLVAAAFVGLVFFAVAEPPEHPWEGQSPIVVEGNPKWSTKPIYKTPEELEADRLAAASSVVGSADVTASRSTELLAESRLE